MNCVSLSTLLTMKDPLYESKLVVIPESNTGVSLNKPCGSSVITVIVGVDTTPLPDLILLMPMESARRSPTILDSSMDALKSVFEGKFVRPLPLVSPYAKLTLA